MPTPYDRQRCDAFNAWSRKIGGIDAAHVLTGIGLRTLQRMAAGKQPPPVQMLPRLADHADDNGWSDVARALRSAAEAHDA